MAPYDSDSSGAEDGDYTETNVLLGYASVDANGEEVSRLGGRPDWIDTGKPPSAALARCKVCKDLMVLLLQLNAELPDRFPGHERRLYVFTCKRKSCRRKEGSIRAIRGVRVSAEPSAAGTAKETQPKETATAKSTSQGLGEALFGVKPQAAAASGTAARANPFASPSTPATNPFAPRSASSAATINPFSAGSAPPAPQPSPNPDQPTESLTKTFAETLALNNPQVAHGPPPPPEPWPEEAAQPPAYPIRWLADAEYETLDPTPLPAVPTTTPMDLDSSEGSSGAAGGGGGGKEDKEVFESSMDATFQKFADRVGQNPEQCIRYEFAGQPLLYSKGDAVGRVLHGGEKEGSKELEAEEDGLDGMDWGTIIVGVCERDCQERGVRVGEAGYLEEWAGVQWEELTVKR
ncbi:79a7ac15-9499-4c30-9e4a-2f4fa67f710a [Thermothielavioides terrestris]|uniref:79a7ac15-9499-4c30-9e4a-2f4fa67f710a n=1 Tax=Thermothielavioides terrestris TaxID=2587410 RepID=A0A446BPN1_9PEZI|nr:79a7ac15-9499-4c30-9e4a-2f4fa67f710a [Thermothielavioides terrestris]